MNNEAQKEHEELFARLAQLGVHSSKSDLPDLLQLVESSDGKPNPEQLLRFLQESSTYSGINMVPQEVAVFMATIGEQYGPQTAVDINCGVGRALGHCTYASTRLGIDRDTKLIRLASYLYPDVKFLAGDILSNDIALDLSMVASEHAVSGQTEPPPSLRDTFVQPTRKTFDLVITALPFGQRIRYGNRYEPSEKLLLERALNLLSDEGVIIALSPVNVLTAFLYGEFRRQVLQRYALDMVVDLPAGTLIHTSVPSCILVIRKGKPNDTVYLAEYCKNMSEIIDNLQHGIGSLQIPLDRIHDRWDRHFFDPRFDESDIVLRGERVKRLGDISEAIVRGYPFSSDERHETGNFLILTPRLFRQGRIETEATRRNHYANAIANERFRRCIVREGDILVGMVSDPVVYIYKENDPPAVAGASVAIIRAHDNKYIGAYLQTNVGMNRFLRQVDRKKAGASIRRLSISALKDIRIPILPLADLNAVGDEEIRTASADELEALKQELAVYKQPLADLAIRYMDPDRPATLSVREASAAYRIHHLPSMAQEAWLVMQMSALASFVAERSDRIDAAIQALHTKVDLILVLVQSNQLEIRRIKETPRDEEEKLLRIYSKLNDVVDWMTEQRRTMQEYTEIVQHWLERWDILDRASQQFLSSAEFLFDEIQRVEDSDYSPFIIQYCRALENEILVKLFEPYHVDFHSRIENREQFLSGDLGDRAGNAFLFAKMLKKDDRAYTLGQMSRILQLIKPGGRTVEKSITLRDFQGFALRLFQSRIVNSEYLERVQVISEDYRNRSAHPNVLGVEVACECQQAIRRALNELLASYLIGTS